LILFKIKRQEPKAPELPGAYVFCLEVFLL